MLVNNTALKDKIKPYLNVNGTTGACASEVFPLDLTDAEATEFLTAFLDRLVGNLSVLYNNNRAAGTSNWT